MKNYLKKNYIQILIKLSIIIIFVCFDLLAKKHFQNQVQNQEVISGFLSFVYVKNTGAAFSIFSDSTIPLIVASCIFLVIFIVYDIIVKEKSIWYSISFAFIFAGAFGNLFDRIKYRYVRDFICLDFIDFPIFNIADVCITVGCMCYIIFLIKSLVKNKSTHKGGESGKI